MIKKLINKLRHITMFEILTITWFKLRLMLRYGTIMQDDGKFWPHDGHSSRMLVTKIQDYMGDETQMLFDGKFWWATDQDGNLLSGCDKRDMVVAHITIHRQEREANAEKKATPPEERTDILYLPEVDGGAEGWYHTTEDGDTEGPYRTRDEALIELGEYRERVRAKLWDSEKSDN